MPPDGGTTTTRKSSIVDNQGGNTLQIAIEDITEQGRELCIATAFFSLDALAMISKHLHSFERVRILFGDEADKRQRAELLRRMRELSDNDLAKHRLTEPTLDGLRQVQELFRKKKIEARCYTKRKFHAKAYLSERSIHPPLQGLLGSGNLTRPGLTRNIELNVELTIEQAVGLKEWYDCRWNEAVADDVTSVIEKEIKRQLELYDPFAIYQRALIAWGSYRQGDISAEAWLRIRDILDPHQEQGYRRALQILERENGVMICDGVGLGKSFIALALMEHFCAQKKNVLLIAPRNILESSWNTYLERYLGHFRQPFGTIHEKAMTDLGFEYEDQSDSETAWKKEEELRKLVERADVIVVDESHNFRTPSAQRYVNLLKIVAPSVETKKKVVLLTATPINTEYADLSAQLALITHESGTIIGYDALKIRAAAKELDRGRPNADTQQLTLEGLGEADRASALLHRVLESVLIQRKRATCIELAKAVGKTLLFPKRERPTVVEYDLHEAYREVVQETHKRFKPMAAFLKQITDAYKRAEEAGKEFKPPTPPKSDVGLKFAAFLPELYRKDGPRSGRSYQVEAFLAKMLFVNTLKQLESSPPAFQGIIQSLAIGLIARLSYVFGEAAASDIAEHTDWVKTPINQIANADVEGGLEEGILADVNGTELDNWIENAISQRHLHHKLADFNDAEFDTERWRKDILRDLKYLKEIHRETMEARKADDLKLLKATEVLKVRLAKGQRVVVFTQSQRTAFYLEQELRKRFRNHEVARIDSNVKQETRADILYAFCPTYNPRPRLINRERVDILICTDVLSEGVNMQETEAVINYDIHWNPVRLIQRIGRVDRRLDPEMHPNPHTVSILNFLPPDDIDGIINLVDTVDNRKTMINKTLGLDQAFFKSTDPDDTLKEFNAQLEGEPTTLDKVTERYVRAIADPDPTIRKQVEAMPPGAFGVWENAPQSGTFALFEMEATDQATDLGRDRYKAIIGKPVLALLSNGGKNLDAPDILDMLSRTVPGEKSGNPGDSKTLKSALNELKDAVNQSFREINLPSSIQPKLICWMEMRSE